MRRTPRPRVRRCGNCQVDARAALTGQNGDARVGSKVIDIIRLMMHWKPIVSLCCFRL